jgi:hypothetical protein
LAPVGSPAAVLVVEAPVPRGVVADPDPVVPAPRGDPDPELPPPAAVGPLVDPVPDPVPGTAPGTVVPPDGFVVAAVVDAVGGHEGACAVPHAHCSTSPGWTSVAPAPTGDFRPSWK